MKSNWERERPNQWFAVALIFWILFKMNTDGDAQKERTNQRSYGYMSFTLLTVTHRINDREFDKGKS